MPKRAAEKDELYTAKGMRDLLADEYYAYQGFYERASEIARYYGFSPVETPLLEKEELFESAVGLHTDIVEKEMYRLKTKGGVRLAIRPEGTAPVLRAYFENGLQSAPQPVMLYYFGPFLRHDKPQRGRWRELRQFGLEVIGTAKSISDALVIKLALLCLEEAGLNNLRVEINSIGDNECRPLFRRELINYYRKHVRNICSDCRERLKYNPLRLLDCKEPGCEAVKSGAPSSLDYLCPACKTHFKEVLEYLESLGIKYEINNNLVRGLDYYSRTVFEIMESRNGALAGAEAEKEEPALALASGGRYDGLARALGYRKEVPAVGVAIGVDRVLLSRQSGKLRSRCIKKPKIFFIQLSFDAKLKSLAVIEALRKARIPIAQSLPKDSLGSQLAVAEKLGVSHVLILGQKEALEGTVIVRNMASRSQESLRVEKLPDYLKHLKT